MSKLSDLEFSLPKAIIQIPFSPKHIGTHQRIQRHGKLYADSYKFVNLCNFTEDYLKEDSFVPKLDTRISKS